jgi:hypothetical protein
LDWNNFDRYNNASSTVKPLDVNTSQSECTPQGMRIAEPQVASLEFLQFDTEGIMSRECLATLRSLAVLAAFATTLLNSCCVADCRLPYLGVHRHPSDACLAVLQVLPE